VSSSCGFLLLVFGDAGIAWAEGLAAEAGVPSFQELGAVVLSAHGDGLQDPKSPAALAASTAPDLLQLSADVRIAFSEQAKRLWDDEDKDGDF